MAHGTLTIAETKCQRCGGHAHAWAQDVGTNFAICGSCVIQTGAIKRLEDALDAEAGRNMTREMFDILPPGLRRTALENWARTNPQALNQGHTRQPGDDDDLGDFDHEGADGADPFLS